MRRLKNISVWGRLSVLAFAAGFVVGAARGTHWSWWVLVGPACFALGVCFAVWQVEQMD